MCCLCLRPALGEVSPKDVSELRTRFHAVRDALGRFSPEGFAFLEEQLRRLEERSLPRPPRLVKGRLVRDPNTVAPEELEDFRRSLDAAALASREAGRKEAAFRLGELREAVETLPDSLDGPAAAARDGARAFLEQEGAPAPTDAALGSICLRAPSLLEGLEAATRGSSCQADLDEVVRLLKPATVTAGLDRLLAAAAKPCLSSRMNRAVRDELRLLANGLLARPPNVEGLPLPRDVASQLRKRLAPWLPAQAAELLASAEELPVAGPASAAGREGPPPPLTPAAPPAAAPPAARPEPAGPPVALDPPRPASPARPDTRANWLALDVWQSAWGEFAEIDSLLAYLKRNRITEVYLNPGFAMSLALRAEGRRAMDRLVAKLRSVDVTTIHFLYAELNYPVSEYAAFLRENRDLGITMIADDSEFTDSRVEGFRRNRLLVQREGILYSAFITVEAFGNSGVSDSTRLWALENLDETVLMSYFSCDLALQRAALEPLLSHADARGGDGNVKIAILAGSKRFGKEVSCEKQLGPEGMVSFLRELHTWARTHPSYGGIVLETNERFPSFDVAPRPW